MRRIISAQESEEYRRKLRNFREALSNLQRYRPDEIELQVRALEVMMRHEH